QYLTYHPMKSEKTVPRGTSMATVSERYFCLAVKPQQPWNSFTITPSENIATRLDSNLTVPAKQVVSYEFSSYAGPRDTFYMQKAGFAQAFAIGFMGQIGLILMMFLRFLANIFKNYGVSIIVFSVLVTTALSPFTLISLKSMKKLKDIQPKLDQLKAKHAKDPQKLNQEMLAIFREHKVSPMSGCLPMLLQLPIFFALWSAMTHVIELRGEQFLWIKDLSLPDRLFRFNGFDLNILPILMSGAMYFQSKMSQQSTSSKEAQMFSAPLMSVIFGFMFYGVPSGLVLYWLSNTLTSLFFYRMALK
ncbi:MAG TPA: membrane protein insertase YidC, partial [Blastocatellia bacterium]|nr:membrane protein insertase YidC [Blastocatellia bacterium]